MITRPDTASGRHDTQRLTPEHASVIATIGAALVTGLLAIAAEELRRYRERQAATKEAA